MALVDIGGVIEWPQVGLNVDSTPAYTTTQYTIDATGEIAAAVLCVPKTGTISAITFRTGTVTVGGIVDVRVETIDAATGFPSGTLWGTTTNGLQTILDANDATMFTTTLTLGASVTQGDLIGVSIVCPVTASMQIVGITAGMNSLNFPYGALFTASWAKIAAVPPIVGLQYDDGSYAFVPNIAVVSSLVSTTYGTGTNPNHRALQFQVPWDCRVSGFWACVDADNAADVLLVTDDWDGTDGDALAKVSLDSDIRRTTGFATYKRPFVASVTLTANTIYRLVFKPTTASTVILSQYTVASAAQLDQNGASQDCFLSTANNPNDATDWSSTTTTRPLMGLLIDAIDIPAGGGSGMIIHPGMSGGLRA